MAMRINQSGSSIILLLTLLLLVGFCPSAVVFAQDEEGQQPPGPPVSDEERQRLLDQIRQRMEERQLQQNNRPFPRGGPFGQQPAPEPAAAQAPASTAPQEMSLERAEGETLRLNFKDVDLNTFIKEIAELLGMTPLIIDSNVQGTVTMYSSEPMSKQDVIPLFNLILKQKNAALIEQNGVYQVVPISSGLKAGTDLIEDNPPEGEGKMPVEPSPGQPEGTGPQTPSATPAPRSASVQTPRLATHVVRVEYVPARDLIEPIKLLMTDGGVIMPYDRLNMLILTDYSDSIDRILKIVHLLDSEYMDNDLIDLVKIEHNNSSDVAADLEKIFGNGTDNASTGIHFVSLDRLNSIFVMANSQRGLTSIKTWIEKLDTTTGRNIQTNVYIVKNSTAANIATLIAALYGEGTTSPGGGGTGQPQSQVASAISQLARGAQAGGTTNQQRGSFGSFSSNTGSSSSGFNTGGFTNSGININGQQLGPQFTSSQGISSMVIQGGEFSGLQGTVRLVVDDISNRLIIQSTAADYEFLLETIQQMDVMPRQVVIDARVFEVDLTDDLSVGLGTTLQGRSGNGSGSVFGINLVPNSENTSFSGSFTGANIAYIGTSQELLTAIQALREKTNVKVLEAPSVLAMDGTEAHITVGGEVPYAGSIYYQDINAAQSVQYRDTGVTLYVRPRISASGSVTMEILQEVSGVGPQSSTLGPTFTKSQVETTLTVKDGLTVAIAGLIRDSQGLTRTGFPLLSDIPIIGSLFGTTARAKKRTELIIMITPHIIADSDEHEAFTREFKDSLKNVRKLVDEKNKERTENLQDAIKEEEKEKLNQLKEEEDKRKEEERALRRKRS
jgi:general secretion pathway protein D